MTCDSLRDEPVCTSVRGSFLGNEMAHNNLIILPSFHTNWEDESSTFYTSVWLYLTCHKLTECFLYLVWRGSRISPSLPVWLTFFITCRRLRFEPRISNSCSHTRTHAQAIYVATPTKTLKPLKITLGVSPLMISI